MGNTIEQQRAIDIDGSNIIVSAGAGSGKTAVLTQRVIRKVLSGVDINKLLILTFTNEAANEMKNRIREEIVKNKLDDQLALLDSSYITTFDSFALSLVKKYSYILNIRSDISIVDNNIITIYKYKVLDEIMESMYGDSEFDKLISDFCIKDDKKLKREIILLSSKLDLLLDKIDFIDNYFNNYLTDDFIYKIIERYENIIKYKINELKDIYDSFTSYLSDTVINKLDVCLSPLFNGCKYDDYVLFKGLGSIRYGDISHEGNIIKERFKGGVDELKYLLRFSDTDSIIESIKMTKGYIKVILDIILRMDKLVNEYKDKHGVYEFNDIAHMAIDIVKKNSDICNEVMNSFNEIMVDEYQDTSLIQEEFINLISNNNVYMVGDIKQSIYRFRNANPYIFQSKYNQYANNNGGVKIDLLKNFRSRKETLDNINEIFNLIMDDEIGNANYQLEHNMVYGNINYDKETNLVNNNLEIYNYDSDKFLEYRNYEKELFIISEDINDKIKNKYQVFDKKSGKLRCIRYSDICIITDRNKYLDIYKKILEYNNIPSVIYMDMILTNDLTILVIKNLISLVYYTYNKIYDDKFRYLFVSVSRSFLYEYDDDKIYQIVNNNKIIDDSIIKKCQNININNPLVRVINDILYEFGVYDKLTNLYEINEAIIRISNLVDIASNLSDLGYDIKEFLEYLDEVIDKGLYVKYQVNKGSVDAVKIMNIHKSKGLEFSLCYFTGMDNKFVMKDMNEEIMLDDNLGIIMPYLSLNKLVPTILKDIYKDRFLKEEVSEKIRLFYVALTRCREKMIIVCSICNDRDKYNSLVPSYERLKYRSFLDILSSIKNIDKYIINKEAGYTHEYDRLIVKNIDFLNKEYDNIDKRELNITYNVIKNMTFSKNNLSIKSIDEIRGLEYGSNVHEELEYLDFYDDENMVVRNLFSKLDRDFINIYREYEFKYQDDDVKYHGVIDLMIEYDKYINIIDYKLKNIDDLAYIKQLNGYKRYIEMISNKKVYIYLYSIMNGVLEEIKEVI